jgi:transcriptional regulator with XRE-family HTH domain
MTGEELRQAGIELFGEHGWQGKLADRLGVDRTQIWRYVTNNRVPGPVAAAVECWLENKNK